MRISKNVRIPVLFFSLLLASSLCAAGCSTTEQTGDSQTAHTNPTVNSQSAQKVTTQARTDENDSLKSETPDNPSIDYTNGVFTLDGVSINIPEGLILSDIQDDGARWTDGSDRRELLISSVKTSASSSDMTQRKVAEYLTSFGWDSIRYEDSSVLVCESHRGGEPLDEPSLSDALDENSPYESVSIRDFYTAGSKDGSFVKLSFITRYNNAREYSEDYEWPEGIRSEILDSLQSKNSITYKYDMPEESGFQIPKVATSQLSYSYDTYWDEGYYVVKVSLSNPSFLAWRGKVTVTCRDSHDKIMATKTNWASCTTLYNFDSVYFDDWGSKANRGIYMTDTIYGNTFVFPEDEVRTTPAKIEVTLE